MNEQPGRYSGAHGSPLVSVILSVYNGAKYLNDAIASILGQTYSNFELIIINNGSTDGSAEIIADFTDSRIRMYSQDNSRLAAALNRGISLAKGEFIARQDADDIALPERFEKQVAFLEINPDCGLVGTWAMILEEERETDRSHKHSSENLALQFELLFDNPFVHSSVMIRASVFEKVSPYSTSEDRQPEDYELWSRIAREFEVANIPDALQVYREVKGSMSRTGVNPFLDRLVNLSAENLARLLAREASDTDVVDLTAMAHGAYHRLSSDFSFTTTRDLLFDAAQRLRSSSELRSSEFEGAVRKRQQILRAHYLRYRYGRYLGRAVSGIEKLVVGRT